MTDLLWRPATARFVLARYSPLLPPHRRRTAARVQAGALRRGTGETIRAALLYADLRDFTALSEAAEPSAMIAALGQIGVLLALSREAG